MNTTSASSRCMLCIRRGGGGREKGLPGVSCGSAFAMRSRKQAERHLALRREQGSPRRLANRNTSRPARPAATSSWKLCKCRGSERAPGSRGGRGGAQNRFSRPAWATHGGSLRPDSQCLTQRTYERWNKGNASAPPSPCCYCSLSGQTSSPRKLENGSAHLALSEADPRRHCARAPAPSWNTGRE